MKEFRHKAIDYEDRYVQAKFTRKQVIKKNKRKISKYERTLLKESLRKEVKEELLGDD